VYVKIFELLELEIFIHQ